VSELVAPRTGVLTLAPPALRQRRYWNLLRDVSIAQYMAKDQSTMLGLVWTFFNPLFMLGILFVFFSARAGEGIEHYAIYLLIGIVHFTHFSNSTTGAMVVLYNLRQLTANTVLPKEVLVIGAILSKLPEFAVELAICVAIAYFSGVRLGWAAALLPAIIVVQVLLAVWAALLLSTVHVFVKDAAYVYQMLLRVLFLITPIFYAADFVGHGTARFLLSLNPLAQLIDLSRTAILGGHGLSLSFLLVLLTANGLLIRLALVFFRRLEPKFAEYV
jgi:ABC-type polysaccharide/polyol phosphate export permease